jgi:hypothetical protein
LQYRRRDECHLPVMTYNHVRAQHAARITNVAAARACPSRARMSLTCCTVLCLASRHAHMGCANW